MIIAVAYENGNVFAHFGHTKHFKLYYIEDNKIIKTKIVPTDSSGHGALGLFLKNNNVDTLIVGGIGGAAQTIIKSNGIKLYGGISGNADQAVEDLLNNNLKYNPNPMCNHEHHNCGEHDCSPKLTRIIK